MLGARARAYATRKRGSHKLKAVVGGAGRAQRSRAPVSDTAPASGAIATDAGAGADTGRRGGGERAPTFGARSTAPQVTIWEPVGFPMMRVKSNLSPQGFICSIRWTLSKAYLQGRGSRPAASRAPAIMPTMGRAVAMLGARRQPPAGCARGAGGRGWGFGGDGSVVICILSRVSGRACARVRNRKPMDHPCLSGFPSVAT